MKFELFGGKKYSKVKRSRKSAGKSTKKSARKSRKSRKSKRETIRKTRKSKAKRKSKKSIKKLEKSKSKSKSIRKTIKQKGGTQKGGVKNVTFKEFDGNPKKFWASEDTNFGLLNTVMSGGNQQSLDSLSYCGCQEWKETPIIYKKLNLLREFTDNGSRLVDIPIVEPAESVWCTSYYSNLIHKDGYKMTDDFLGSFWKYFGQFAVYVASVSLNTKTGHHVRLYLDNETYRDWHHMEKAFIEVHGQKCTLTYISAMCREYANKYASVNALERQYIYEFVAQEADKYVKLLIQADGFESNEEARDFYFSFLRKLSNETMHIYTYEINSNFNVEYDKKPLGQIVRYVPLVQQSYILNDGINILNIYPPLTVHIRDAHATCPTSFMFKWLDTYWKKKLLVGYSPLYINTQHQMRIGSWAGYFSAKRTELEASIFTPEIWLNTYGRIFCKISDNLFTSCGSDNLDLIYRNFEPSGVQWYKNIASSQNGECPGLSTPPVEKNRQNLKNYGTHRKSVPHAYGVDELGASYLFLDSRNKYYTEVGAEKYLKELGNKIQFLNCHHYTNNWRGVTGLFDEQLIKKKMDAIKFYIENISVFKDLSQNPQKYYQKNAEVKETIKKIFTVEIDPDYKFNSGRHNLICRYLRARQLNDDEPRTKSFINLNDQSVASLQHIRTGYDQLSEISYTIFRYIIDLSLVYLIGLFSKAYIIDKSPTGERIFKDIVRDKIYLPHIYNELFHNPYNVSPNPKLNGFAPTIIWNLASCINLEPQVDLLSIPINKLNPNLDVYKEIEKFLMEPIGNYGDTPLKLLGLHYTSMHESNSWKIWCPFKDIVLKIPVHEDREFVTKYFDYYLEETHYQNSKCPSDLDYRLDPHVDMC